MEQAEVVEAFHGIFFCFASLGKCRDSIFPPSTTMLEYRRTLMGLRISSSGELDLPATAGGLELRAKSRVNKVGFITN